MDFNFVVMASDIDSKHFESLFGAVLALVASVGVTGAGVCVMLLIGRVVAKFKRRDRL